MARVNVYLPDDLADKARLAGLNVSGLTREAIRRALAAHQVDEWLDGIARLRAPRVPHADVIKAVAEARKELDRFGG